MPLNGLSFCGKDRVSLHSRLNAPVGGQIFTGVLVTKGYGQIFSGDLEFCNEDSIIIGVELFLRENNISNFSPGFACLLPRFHL